MKSFCLFVMSIIVNVSLLNAQTIDSTFHAPLPIRPAKIECIKILPNGKTLLGGDIAFFKTARVNNLIKLYSDNTIDSTFQFIGNKSLLIKEIEIQSTGDIIVLAQRFESLTNVYLSNNSLFQLDANGKIKKEIDTLSFVTAFAVQRDDKILLSSGVGQVGWLTRIKSDLSADSTFNKKVVFNNFVSCVTADSSKLLVAGMFTAVNGKSKNSIVKLNLDGTIDSTFNTGSGTNDYIGSLTLQTNGKILLGRANINSFNGVQCFGMVRLNPDGSVDTGFNPPVVGITSDIVTKGSAIYVVTTINNFSPNHHLFRLKSNGTVDTDFKPFPLDAYAFNDFSMGFTGNDLIFNNSATTGSTFGLSKCDSIGKQVKTFNPEVGRFGLISNGDYFNDKLVIAGDFIKVNGVSTYGIARLNKDGLVDSTFLMPKNMGSVMQLKVLNKDSMLVSFGSEFIRLNSKAQIYPDFNFHPFKTLYQILKFRVLANGKIIAGDPNNVYRLNSNGTEDATFNIGTGIGGGVFTSFDFDLQSNKVIYGSNFNQFNGTNVNKLIRLNTDASVDTTFKIGTGPDDAVTMIKVLNSGEMIIGGPFKKFNGIDIPNRIVKLTKDGAVDSTFIRNQKYSAFSNGVEVNYVKIEQIDSMIYIKGVTTVAAIDVNGVIYNSFKIPLIVNQINDIITLKDSSQNITGKKSGSLITSKSFMYAFGSFNQSNNNDPSFIVKMVIGQSSIPEPAFLSATPGALSVLSTANSTAIFNIASNVNWSVKSSQTWLTTSKLMGSDSASVTVTASANVLTSPRIDTLTISSTGMTNKTILVTQAAAIPTDVINISNVEVTLYPIPVKNKLLISSSNTLSRIVIAIYTLTGIEVYSSAITNNITEVDMSKCATGVYLVKITTLDKGTVTRKIIKQ